MGWACEPKLEDLLRDHTLRLLMQRDGVAETAIRELAARTARVLGAHVEIAPASPSLDCRSPARALDHRARAARLPEFAGNNEEAPCAL